MATNGPRHTGRTGPTKDLLDFYDEVDATLHTYTQMVRMRPLAVPSAAAFISWLRPFTDEGRTGLT